MTKAEFMARLQTALSQMPQQERDDILNDYEEHFRIGGEQGKTEEEIAAALGSPEELGSSYNDGEGESPNTYEQPPVQSNPAPESAPVPPVPPEWQPGGYYTQEPGRAPEYTARSEGNCPPPYQGYYQQPPVPGYGYPQPPFYPTRTPGERAAYTVLMVCLTLFIVLPVGGGVAVGLWFIILGIGIAAGAVSVAMLVASAAGAGFTLIGIAFACLCVSILFGLAGYTGGVIKLFISYFRMCSRVINGNGVAYQ